MPTVYRYDDSSAPSVTGGSVGSFLAMLRACLVNGYGSKSPAGWTEAYTGTNVAAFRNSTSGGTGCYVRVSDTSNDNNVFPVTITAYASMSDVNTGTDATASVYAARRPSQSGTNALQWVVVADQYTFYVTGRTTGSTKCFLVGAGDLESLQTSDAFRYFTAGDFLSSSVFNEPPPGLNCTNTFNNPFFGAAPSTSTSSSAFVSMGRDYTGTGGEARHSLMLPMISTSSQPSTNAFLGGNNFPARPAANGVNEAALPAYVGRREVIRGKLRGVYLPLANITGFASGTIGTTVSAPDFGGASSVVIPMLAGGSSPHGGIWVETALGW